ncbi:MAG: hypothetical protein CM1200mP10_15440 [Candidatus Neomarinimicrobiota bacterium]|nr:MAG: hypothetical protein CM1200mP10_15440 [Candidatus Neomarinimicrobiota bacterium]
MARAAGVDWDIRVNESYSCYEDFDFDVAIALNGDVFDRYLVRMEEIRQSIKICRQSLDKMPTGNVKLIRILDLACLQKMKFITLLRV